MQGIYGLKRDEIKGILIDNVNSATDQMLYLDDATVDAIDGLSSGIAEAITKHVDKYMNDWMSRIRHEASLR